jgi:hypothetical protein
MSGLDERVTRVPEFDRFLTVKELYSRAYETAARHPGIARVEDVGRSSDGQPIPMVTIGNGPARVILVGCPHPNEPIGAMLVHFLLDELIENRALREGRTWYLLPCVDPDGTRLNESWFRGPMTVETYARHFYRPASEEQVEWTFPTTYKTFSWTTPLPETSALMTAFERSRPQFVYSLHNAGFGGVYYYVSRDVPAAVETLHAIPGHLGMPLSLGEPEVPWARQYAPAVFQMTSIKQAYDYYARVMDGDPADLITGGGSSIDYLESLGSPLMLLTEVPYFLCTEIADTTPIDRTRREVLLQGADRARAALAVLTEIVEGVRPAMTEDTRLWRAPSAFIKTLPKRIEAHAKWAAEAEETAVRATVAQQADELYVGTFYRVVVASMLRRAFDAQLRVGPSDAVQRARERLEAHLGRWIAEIEANLHYRFVGIRKLVQAQYAAMLAVMP